MEIKTTKLSSVFIIAPRRFEDDRGFFEESWNAGALADHGIETSFVQDNHSYSKKLGTIRGLHFQSSPHAQVKLVRCTRGSIFDVAVDVRKGSPTYGQWLGEELSRENGKQLLIPKGFLHGFLTLMPETEVQYKCSDKFAPHCDGSVLWDSLDIDWPLPNGISPMLSAKDEAAQPFDTFDSPFSLEDMI
jgi:dTDP-4-dehydrorhamnose 3,5-epimerase|tara:strand:+ start:447 stop:1013 length:567 start_codon:yes stop_codon:yes gene_type:complete